MAISWGAAEQPKQGQMISGDRFVVVPFEPSGLQVAVIDGLGGGLEAAQAAEAAVAVIQQQPNSDPNVLMQQAHQALHGTRGAVMALLTFDLARNQVSYVGVGNIGAYVYSTHPIKPISKNGIIGYRLPTLLKLTYSYNFGDTFVLYSDGISGRFTSDAQIEPDRHPQDLAELIMRLHGKRIDDATVVVVRVTE